MKKEIYSAHFCVCRRNPMILAFKWKVSREQYFFTDTIVLGFFHVFYKTKSGMIENQMVNFEPGEYMRKMVFQSVTQVAQKKKYEHSLFMTIFLLVQMLYH